MTISELLEIRSALHQCRDMLVGHDKEIAGLTRRSEQGKEANDRQTIGIELVQREIAELKATAAENRRAIQNLFFGVVTALIVAYLSKFIK
jgi:hypothetical protein